MIDATRRFAGRADSYAKHRPDYPSAVLTALVEGCGLTRSTAIADVGAGTGIFTEALLRNGNPVAAVEPNGDMRAALHRLRPTWPGLRVVDGTAANTSLASESVGLVTVAQAFHWFDPVATRREFVRILRPGGWVALLWNQRDNQSTRFLQDYEALLLEFAPEYRKLQQGPVDLPVLDVFFRPAGFSAQAFANEYDFELDRLRGLLESTSYAPEPGHAAFAPMVTRLSKLFSDHQSGGTIKLKYSTRLFYGQLRD